MSCGCNPPPPRDNTRPRPVYAGEAFRVIQVTKKGTRRVWGWSNAADGGEFAAQARIHKDTGVVLIEHEDLYRRTKP